MTIAERTSIAVRLEAIQHQVQEINRLVTSNTPADIEIARETFTRLKEHLKTEYDRMQTTKGQEKLSQGEQAFYLPAIQDAWANTELSETRADWAPGKWHNALWNVQDYMQHHLSSLRRVAD